MLKVFITSLHDATGTWGLEEVALRTQQPPAVKVSYGLKGYIYTEGGSLGIARTQQLTFVM